MAESGPEWVFHLPSLGADMESGSVLRWYVEPGDEVERGAVVALVATDKADIDVEIWHPGTVTEHLVAAEVEVPVGTPLLRLAGTGPTGPGTAPPTVDRQAAMAGSVAVTGPASPTSAPPSSPAATASTARSDGWIPSSPWARTLAHRRGIDLAAITGSGPSGAVLGRDVEGAGTGTAGTGTAGAETTGRPRRGSDRSQSMRQAIASQMAVANRDIPHYYLQHDVDMGPALAWLEEHNAEVPVTERVLPVALLLRAAAAATAAVSELNGWWLDGRFEPAETVDLAVVISLRRGGLVTPKIASADQLDLAQLMAAVTELVAAARRGSLRSSWMTGAGMTVSNLGDRGVDRLDGVVFPPQVALVGFGGIRSRPWVVDGEIVARPILTVSLAADHRATDGTVGSRFLTLLAEHLENPEDA